MVYAQCSQCGGVLTKIDEKAAGRHLSRAMCVEAAKIFDPQPTATTATGRMLTRAESLASLLHAAYMHYASVRSLPVEHSERKLWRELTADRAALWIAVARDALAAGALVPAVCTHGDELERLRDARNTAEHERDGLRRALRDQVWMIFGPRPIGPVPPEPQPNPARAIAEALTDGRWQIVDPKTGHVFATCATQELADALLNTVREL